MAKGTSIIQISHADEDFTLPSGTQRLRLVNAVVVFLMRFVGGFTSRTTSVSVGQTGARASGTLTIASGSGTVGGSINGVSVTVTWATSDTNTATLLAAAINASANALVSGVVTASAALGVVTLTAVEYGKTGNAVTLAASGTGVTASGARLTGGVAPGFVSLTR